MFRYFSYIRISGDHPAKSYRSGNNPKEVWKEAYRDARLIAQTWKGQKITFRVHDRENKNPLFYDRAYIVRY